MQDKVTNFTVFHSQDTSFPQNTLTTFNTATQPILFGLHNHYKLSCPANMGHGERFGLLLLNLSGNVY